MKRYLSALVLFASGMGSVYAAAPPVVGLRADLYSSTAAELFWNRVPNQTLRYEVMRNDGPVGFTDGTSYTDLGRIPG